MRPSFVAALGAATIAFGLVAVPRLVTQSQLFSLTDVLTMGLFAVSYNLLLGYGGMLSFGHSAYFGLSAYASALLLAKTSGLHPLIALLGGVATSAFAGAIVGAICVRRSGPYFSMLTLAFGMLFYTTAWKWRGLTKGDDGFGDYMPAKWSILFLDVQSGDIAQKYRLVLLVVAVILTLLWVLMKYTAFGNAVTCVKQNEERAAFLGYDTFKVKLTNHTLASAVAGLAGGLFAMSHNFVSTDVIGIERSTEVVMMTYLGGAFSFVGPLLGSAFVVIVGDLLATITARWQLVMGLIFIVMIMFVPRGFAGLFAALGTRAATAARGRFAASVVARRG